jgi:hypothetical protein
LCLSDDLKRRILCTFLSLMNLKENLERTPLGNAFERGIPVPEPFPPPAVGTDWLKPESRASLAIPA